MKLAEFAFCPKQMINNLKDIGDREVNYNYLDDKFRQACDEGKLDEKYSYAVFPIGLFKEDQEIYAYFEKNKKTSMQKWFLKEFYTTIELVNMGSLYDYAYCDPQKIDDLKEKCLPEKWSFSGRGDNSILKNYLDYTFRKVRAEGKLYERDSYAVFHTGLFTKQYQEIYAYFGKNNVKDKQEWYLEGFYTPYKLKTEKDIGLNNLLGKADHYSKTCVWGHIQSFRDDHGGSRRGKTRLFRR